METSFGSRASSSRWPSVVHAMLTGQLLSDGCVGVAASASRRRRRGEFYFCDVGWMGHTGAGTHYSLAWLLDRFVGVLRTPPARLEPPDAQKSAGARTNELSGGFYLGSKMAENASSGHTDPSEASKRGASSGTSRDGGRSQHRRPRYRHAIIARLGGRVHRAVRSCDCQDRVSSSARGETHLAGRQGTS